MLNAKNPPRHTMFAFKTKDLIDQETCHMEAHDDDEFGGGEKILNVMLDNNLVNTAVVVCRWYGGEHLFQARFKAIEQCAQLVCGISPPKPSPETAPIPRQRKILYISDSTGGRIDLGRISPNSNSKKLSAPTLESATAAVGSTSDNFESIVIQTGTNNIGSEPVNSIVNKISILLKTTKSHHPKASIFITSILPSRGELDYDTREINRSIKTQVESLGGTYIDSASKFVGRSDLFWDHKHTNRWGTGVLAGVLRSFLSPRSDTPSNRNNTPNYRNDSQPPQGNGTWYNRNNGHERYQTAQRQWNTYGGNQQQWNPNAGYQPNMYNTHTLAGYRPNYSTPQPRKTLLPTPPFPPSNWWIQ